MNGASEATSCSRAARARRTAISLAVLLAFWGALAYTFWPELLPALLRLVQSARGVGAREVESAYLEVRDNSTAGEAAVQRAVERLETDYLAIHEFLGRQPVHRVPVLITNGSGPALTDGVRLNVFHNGHDMDLSSAPFFLVLLSEGELSMPGIRPFVEGGYAVYVVEEIGRAGDLLRQSTDAWVALLMENGTLMPLSEAWMVELPEGEDELIDFLRALLEGGSFMRWLARAYGFGAVRDLWNGLTVEEVTGLSLAEAEKAWLESVASLGLRPLPCIQAVPEGSFLRSFCGQLDVVGGQRP